MSSTVSKSSRKPKKQSPRTMAMREWDNALESLDNAASLYVRSTTEVFRQFSQEDATPASYSKGNLSVEDGLLHIDRKLERLAALERILQDARVGLQALRNTSTVLSPIRRLPPEILANIISNAVEDDRLAALEKDDALYDEEDALSVDEFGNETFRPQPPYFPTLFSHVCRQWRVVALNVNHLWTKIDFSEGPPYDCALDWLSRSGECEISLYFDVEDPRASLHEESNMDMALKLVAPHKHRVGVLFARTSTVPDLIHIIAHLTDDEIPMPLKRLALLAEDTEGQLLEPSDTSPRTQILRKVMEGLVEVELEKVSVPWNSPAFFGLRTLRICTITTYGHRPTTYQIYNIMKACPELEELDLETVEIMLCEPDNVSEATFPPVILSKLTTISLCQLDLPAANFLFTFMCAPNLEKLSFIDWEIPLLSDSANVKVHLSKFFDRIKPTSLRRLRFDECTYTESDIILVLSAAPSLEDLFFNSCDGVNDAFLAWLKGTDAPACPLLKSLKFDSCTEFSAEALKQVVLAREESGTPLKSLWVKYCALDGDERHWFEERVQDVTWGADSDDEDVDDDDAGMTDGTADVTTDQEDMQEDW